jgi:hypothetical protein
MKVAYFDCFSGISGDMCLGALLANGLSPEELIAGLKYLALEGWELKIKEVKHQGITAVDVQVQVQDHHHHRHLEDILRIINDSPLPVPVREKATAIFRRLAQAEAQVHGISPEEVHFHEVGAVDAIIDIVGTVLGLHLLGIARVMSSPLPLGSGWTECHHGRLPVPAPATLYLLQGYPVYGTEVEAEVVTPTGAAIITTLADRFGPFPPMNLISVGFGAGKTKLPHPNILRLALGEMSDTAGKGEDSILVLETTIDDMNPEFFPVLMEQVLGAGAVDAYFIPVHMKKGRPGLLFTVLCPESRLAAVAAAIFRHSSTLGLRFRRDQKLICQQQITEVLTPYGPVAVKWGLYHDHEGQAITNIAPEYESCRQVALAAGVPIKEVYTAALAAARSVLVNS